MDNDELLAVLQGHFAGVNQRIDDMRVYLGSRIDDAKVDLGRRIDETNKRIDDAKADLGGQIDKAKADLGGRIDRVEARVGGRIDETNRRIDTVGRFKYQGAALVVALAAAIAVIGTFALQVLAAL